MMRSVNRALLLLGASAILGGCGAQLYRPSTAALGKSVEAMVPVLNSDLADYPNELRSALLENAAATSISAYKDEPSELLCKPVRTSVELAAASNKLQTASDSLIRVSGESPTSFSELAAAAALGKYSISGGTSNPVQLAAQAHAECIADFDFPIAYANFIGTGGVESFGTAAAGLTELWGLVKPIAVGVLGFVDQQRRERAIVAYLRTDGRQLMTDVNSFAEFSKKKAAYERAVAARTFASAMEQLPVEGATDEQRQAVLEAAATYDAIRAVDATSAYQEVGKSIGRLIKVSEGIYSEADLSAAISGFGQSFSALKQIGDNIAALEKGGDKNEALRAAIAKIRGKKEKADAAADSED